MSSYMFYNIPPDAPKIDYSKMKLTGEQVESIKQKWRAEDLQNQVKAAKEKYKELKVKVTKVDYDPFNETFYIYFVYESGQEDIYCFEKSQIKCLENLADNELLKVSALGERAIQFEELDIQIGVEELLYGLQIINSWLHSLR
jgi:hypothetical protein